ncbi:MAG: hypothetical protein PHC70_01600 [Patescibacteria group bacterium]|nr:hypothetical protein [Patescibacteria group bacterium]
MSLVTDVPDKVELCFSVPVEYMKPNRKELKSRYDVIESDYDVDKYKPIHGLERVGGRNRVRNFGLYRCFRTFAHYPILEIIYDKGLRPGLYEELLSFDYKFPEEKRRLPIGAQGSVVDCVYGVPCSPTVFFSTEGERVLSGEWVERGWHPNYYQLLVTAR